jgi:hypothetical protein
MGINVSTLYKYQNEHGEIIDALKRGKAPVDNEVENALLKRARGGFEVKEKRIEKWKDADGNEREHTVIITREVPPDVTAQIYWLNNRRPDTWRNRKAVDRTGSGIEDALAKAREILGGVHSVVE